MHLIIYAFPAMRRAANSAAGMRPDFRNSHAPKAGSLAVEYRKLSGDE
jgi:hypothetical protein